MVPDQTDSLLKISPHPNPLAGKTIHWIVFPPLEPIKGEGFTFTFFRFCLIGIGIHWDLTSGGSY